ncbi:hypothetical protein D3C80_1718870 [compost metagenome]
MLIGRGPEAGQFAVQPGARVGVDGVLKVEGRKAVEQVTDLSVDLFQLFEGAHGAVPWLRKTPCLAIPAVAGW